MVLKYFASVCIGIKYLENNRVVSFDVCLFLAQQARRGQGLLIHEVSTRVGTLIVVTIYLQLIQNRYMFRRFTVLQCSHQHCLQPVASDVEVVRYL